MIETHRPLRQTASCVALLACLSICLSAFLSACASSDKELWDAIQERSTASDGRVPPTAPSPDARSTGSSAIELPESAKPDPRLEPLEFLAGRWVAINPNGTVNEEVWTPPRGNVAIGTFRQVRRDKNCAFVEISQIALEEDEIILRLRHLHGRLEVPGSRGDVSMFRLVSLDGRRVEFAGTEAAAGVTSVVYERTSASELVQSIGFSPESGEKPFVTHYTLDGR